MTKETSIVDLTVEVKKFTPSDEDIRGYIVEQHKALENDPGQGLSFNQYLKDKYFANDNVIIAPDLSNRELGKDNGITDLRGGDFTGCIFKNTSFKDCNLADAVFCDVDFDNAYFKDSVLTNIDFRGADLANCRFSDNYKDYAQMGKERDIAGIKFSTTSSLARIYADIKSDSVRAREQQDIIKKKTQERDEAYTKLGLSEKANYALGKATGNAEYDRLEKELNLMKEKKIFPRSNNFMHETFQNIFGSSSCTFDPAYIRGMTKEERDQEVQYVPLKRQDVEQYLEARKNNQELSLNDFAKSKLVTSQIKPGARIVADCSSRVDISTNNKWHDRVDLSGLNFSGADLSGAVFTGSVLNGCNFSNANISEVSFEGAELITASFVGTMADNANFFNSDLRKAQIDKGNFTHSFMARSNGTEVQISASNFDYANINHAKWDQAKLEGSTFNHANLEGISLISADLRKVQMQHAILDKAILSNCQIIESDLSQSLMNETKANKAQFKNVVLENIQAKSLDLSEAELDSLTKLDGADLEAAVLRKINAEGVSFINANLQMVDAYQANFRNAILQQVNMKFSNLQEAILVDAKAQGVNMSYSILNKIQAQRVDFSNSVMRRMEAQEADFTEVNFTKADLTGSNLMKTILERIQAEQSRLEEVKLQQAKLAEANLSNAIIDIDTNFVGADLNALKGKLIQNGQEIDPHQLQAEQTKATLVQIDDRFKNISSLIKEAINSFSSVTTLPQLAILGKEIYGDLQKWQEVGQKLSNTLLAAERKELKKTQVEYGNKLIGNLGIMLNKYIPDLNNPQLDLINNVIAHYALPIVAGIIDPTPLVPHTHVKRVNQDIFAGIDKPFIRRTVPLVLNLTKSLLNEQSIPKVQAIYQDLMLPGENSQHNIMHNIIEILANPKVVEMLQNDLGEFLRSSDNQPQIAKILERYFDDDFTRFVSPEFSRNTILLLINSTSAILEHTPEIALLYKLYTQHQDFSLELLGDKNLSATRKEDLTVAQAKAVSLMIDTTDKMLKDFAPALKSTLPQYFAENKENILNFLDKPEIQQTIRSYGINPSLVKEATSTSIPFIAEMLPIMTEFAEKCLQDKDGLGQIIKHVQDAMNAPKSEEFDKTCNLVDSLIKFKNDNPEVKDILQKKIPKLLIKHANDLGPVVEKLLNETEIGRKLKLKGGRVVEVLGEHAQGFGKIVTAYEKKDYAGMVLPLFELVSDYKVLGLIVSSVVNISKYAFHRYMMSNVIREKAIGKQLNQIIENTLSEEASLIPKVAEKNDLAAILQEKAEKYDKDDFRKHSSILEYSLTHKDLSGISFEKIDMKLDNFEIKGFNLNNVTLGKCSIKGAVLKDCSFKGAVFKEPIDFTDVTVDGNTLTTLLPRIAKYNKQHPDKLMNLDKVKVIGDIREEIKENPLLKSADLTKATVIKVPTTIPGPACGSEYIKNIRNKKRAEDIVRTVG